MPGAAGDARRRTLVGPQTHLLWHLDGSAGRFSQTELAVRIVAPSEDRAVGEEREGVLVAGRNGRHVPRRRVVAERQQHACGERLRARRARPEPPVVPKSPRIEACGHRVVAARLPGHGERVVQATSEGSDPRAAALEERHYTGRRREVIVALLGNRCLARRPRLCRRGGFLGTSPELAGSVVAPRVPEA